MKNFAKNLREWRERTGTTQAKLSALTGIAQSTISAWEQERADPSAFHMLKLIDAIPIESIDALRRFFE